MVPLSKLKKLTSKCIWRRNLYCKRLLKFSKRKYFCNQDDQILRGHSINEYKWEGFNSTYRALKKYSNLNWQDNRRNYHTGCSEHWGIREKKVSVCRHFLRHGLQMKSTVFMSVAVGSGFKYFFLCLCCILPMGHLWLLLKYT